MLSIFGHEVRAGDMVVLEPPIGKLLGHDTITMPTLVICGKRKGPTLLVTAAIHGDEINGVEIVRRLLYASWARRVRGCLIAIPIVNVFGVMQRSRYLPDRRDLNRCFPGSASGSLGARMAHFLTEDVLKKVDMAIDLHTGAIGRTNLPQIRVSPDNPTAMEMALAFGAPVVLTSELKEGTFRNAGDALGIPVITYEAGEALRYDQPSIIAGVNGVRNVLEQVGMIRTRVRKKKIQPAVAPSSSWVRSPTDGFFRTVTQLGARIRKGDILGYVSGPLKMDETAIVAPFSGIIVGQNQIPQVYEGEALYHVARFERVTEAEAAVDKFQATMTDMIDIRD
ncbi:MAG: succinylglutamate desuccinylase [Gammaproteobacteria bacterium]|nr:MAG: succinylglutamate desuccinylase [Gammaproteobacteria bacterium]